MRPVLRTAGPAAALLAVAAVGGPRLTPLVSVLGALAVLAVGLTALHRPGRARRRRVADVAEGGRRQWASLYQLESTVLIGLQSRHHFDAALRPRLSRVLQVLAAGRRGVDLAARPDRGPALVGDEVWPLLDPARPAATDSRRGGVDVTTLERALDRIERL